MVLHPGIEPTKTFKGKLCQYQTRQEFFFLYIYIYIVLVVVYTLEMIKTIEGDRHRLYKKCHVNLSKKLEHLKILVPWGLGRNQPKWMLKSTYTF